MCKKVLKTKKKILEEKGNENKGKRGKQNINAEHAVADQESCVQLQTRHKSMAVPQL